MEIKPVNFFPTEVYFTEVKDSLCDEIIKLVNKEKTNWKKNLANVEAITSGWDGLRYPIIKEIAEYASNSILKSIGLNKNWKYNNWNCREAWINIYQKNDKSNSHSHFFNDYCAILIVQPSEGNLFFTDPKDVHSFTRPFENKNIEKINEQKGMFIFFPSTLFHAVSSCQNERITVAFNFENNSQ